MQQQQYSPQGMQMQPMQQQQQVAPMSPVIMTGVAMGYPAVRDGRPLSATETVSHRGTHGAHGPHHEQRTVGIEDYLSVEVRSVAHRWLDLCCPLTRLSFAFFFFFLFVLFLAVDLCFLFFFVVIVCF
jgi:hypothetical protein